jgi:hypothetical protein
LLDSESLNTELFVSANEVQECRQWLQARALDNAMMKTGHAPGNVFG